MLKKIAIAATIVLVALTSGLAPASAQRLIRGDVGRFFHQHVNPVATPLVRQGVVQGGCAIGTYIAGEAGCMVGRHVGGVINERAAGQSTFARPANSYPMNQPVYQQPAYQPPPPAYQPPMYPQPMYQQPMYPQPIYQQPVGMYRPMPVMMPPAVLPYPGPRYY